MVVDMKISVNLHGLDKKLEDLEKGTMNLKTPLSQSATYMERSIGNRFRQANWKPLSPTTIKVHPHRAGGKPLNDTGLLRRSVTSQAIKTVRPKQLVYGTNLVYAPMHNFGGIGGWGFRIPQREFLYFDEKDARAIKRIFEDYIKELSQ